MGNKSNIGIIVVIIFAIAAYFGFQKTNHSNSQQNQQSSYIQKDNNPAQNNASIDAQGLQRIQEAHDKQQRDIPVQAKGVVKAVLRDDTEGSKHQKFILKLDNGLSVLVAHNIDLASRIDQLKKGDVVEFKGDYEYNEKGGVIHWTHHDPHGKHADGWLKMDGKIYQ